MYFPGLAAASVSSWCKISTSATGSQKPHQHGTQMITSGHLSARSTYRSTTGNSAQPRDHSDTWHSSALATHLPGQRAQTIKTHQKLNKNSSKHTVKGVMAPGHLRSHMLSPPRPSRPPWLQARHRRRRQLAAGPGWSLMLGEPWHVSLKFRAGPSVGGFPTFTGTILGSFLEGNTTWGTALGVPCFSLTPVQTSAISAMPALRRATQLLTRRHSELRRFCSALGR